MHAHPCPKRPAPRRSGFTLVEVLMVIGIIAFLVTLLIFALGASLESARIAATRTTLMQLDSMLQQRLDAFNRLDLRSQAQQFRTAYNNSNPQQITLDQAEFMVRKDRYKQLFPQRLEDLHGYNGNAGGAGAHPNPPNPAPSNSAEWLYWMLTNGTSHGLPTIDVDSINQNHIDQSGTHPRFIDEWGNPLRFYSAPTRLIKPDGLNIGDLTAANALIAGLPTGSLNQDPWDPTGMLVRWDPTGDNPGPFQNSFNLQNAGAQQPFGSGLYHDPNTYFTFLIVSAGPDGELGMDEPTAAGASRLGNVTNLDAVFDNITNRQR